jgi:cell shape-determining protein MreC
VTHILHLQVANAMAAKAKLLLRELKTVKADLAFAKERCAQLEDENKILRESHDKGDNPEDDDLVSNFSLKRTSNYENHQILDCWSYVLKCFGLLLCI